MATKQLSPQERANNFALATRQYIQTLPDVTFADGQSVSFSIPKVRFLQKITLMVKGTFKTSHASKTTFTKSVFDKYNLIKQIRMTVNGSMNPYQISGQMLKIYNDIYDFTNDRLEESDVFKTEVLENVVSVSGTTNKVKFALDLPVTINDRDTVGIIMAQSDQTNINITIDFDSIKKIMTDTDINVSDVNIVVTPVVETYSIPPVAEAIPDYSILKLVNQQVQNVVSAGEMTIDLQTALTYRKLFVYVAKDTNLTPMEHEKIQKFSLVFNQADIPYNVSADYVALKNRRDYQGSVPLGCYVFDFSSQGIANYGGAKNYIDTERMTSLQLKAAFQDIVGNSNYIYIVGEKLARLI